MGTKTKQTDNEVKGNWHPIAFNQNILEKTENLLETVKVNKVQILQNAELAIEYLYQLENYKIELQDFIERNNVYPKARNSIETFLAEIEIYFTELIEIVGKSEYMEYKIAMRIYQDLPSLENKIATPSEVPILNEINNRNKPKFPWDEYKNKPWFKILEVYVTGEIDKIKGNNIKKIEKLFPEVPKQNPLEYGYKYTQGALSNYLGQIKDRVIRTDEEEIAAFILYCKKIHNIDLNADVENEKGLFVRRYEQITDSDIKEFFRTYFKKYS